MPCTIVTCDYNDKFLKAFDQVFQDRSIQVKRVGPQAPNLNAFIERWIQYLKYEAWNHLIMFGPEHFDYIVSEYVGYYHERRPHQGIGNVPLPWRSDEPAAAMHNDESDFKLLSLANIRCRTRLGGLLKHFYRAAA